MTSRKPQVATDARQLQDAVADRYEQMLESGQIDPELDGYVEQDDETGVVMTMGALHEGHAALLRQARQRCAVVVATIFVTPLQFGPGEDFGRYPRSFEADLAVCAREGVDIVFAPTPEEVYPAGPPRVRIQAGPAGEVLEGEFRPGHFDGVLTVVAKLLHLTEPDVAFFGRKDAQQLALVQQLVTDLDFDVEIVGVDTVRDEDGLALSSRNRYLSSAERATALALPRALLTAAEAVTAGVDPAEAHAAAMAELAAAAEADPPLRLDYLALVDPETFGPAQPAGGPVLLATAARVGATRLIDNVLLEPAGHRSRGPRPVIPAGREG